MKFKPGQLVICKESPFHFGFIVGCNFEEYTIMFSGIQYIMDKSVYYSWFQKYNFDGLEKRFELALFGDPVYDTIV